MKSLNQKNDLRIFRIILLVFISFFSTYSYAQKSETPKKEQATIVLVDGATIYSKDEAFNKQISNNIVVIKNSDISDQENSNKSNLQIVAKKTTDEKGNLKNQLKAAQDKKQKEVLKKIKKQIDEHNEKKKSFLNERVDRFPSSETLTSSSYTNRDYVASSYNGHSFSKMYTAENIYVVFLALDFLHSQKITHYNSKSLAYCFSEVYSVRPPPAYS